MQPASCSGDADAGSGGHTPTQPLAAKRSMQRSASLPSQGSGGSVESVDAYALQRLPPAQQLSPPAADDGEYCVRLVSSCEAEGRGGVGAAGACLLLFCATSLPPPLCSVPRPAPRSSARTRRLPLSAHPHSRSTSQPVADQAQLSTALIEDTVATFPVAPDAVSNVHGPVLEVHQVSAAAGTGGGGTAA
jgi:hypothetical protein